MNIRTPIVGTAHLSIYKKKKLFLSLLGVNKNGLNLHMGLKLQKEVLDNLHPNLLDIQLYLEQGDGIRTAFEKTKLFKPFELETIGIGEKSSDLGTAFSELIAHYDRSDQIRHLILKALSYPLMVLASSFFVTLFMFLFVVPAFEEVFQRSGNSLPMLSRIIMGISSFLIEYTFLLLALFGTLSVAFILYWQLIFRFIQITALRVPYFGSKIQNVFALRWVNLMAIMLRAELPFHKALKILSLSEIIPASHQNQNKVLTMIMEGRPIHESLLSMRIFSGQDQLGLRTLQSREDLTRFFTTKGEDLTKSLEKEVESLGKFIEPILLLFVGAVVALILIAMYMPLFQLGNQY